VDDAILGDLKNVGDHIVERHYGAAQRGVGGDEGSLGAVIATSLVLVAVSCPLRFSGH